VAPAELSIITPTYNESANIEELVRRVDEALQGVRWELIIVDDDSPDGTAEVARRLSTREARVRCIRRIGRRGLASACIEGMLSSSAPFLAVMDADLQHDPSALPRMLTMLRADAADLVIGSRYVDGGSVGEWDSRRQAISRFAIRLSTLVTRRAITDPVSGFFMLKREVLDACVSKLSALGFKILLDIVASSDRSVRIAEVPIRFGARHSGETKLSGAVVWEYLLLLADKLVGAWLPVRFVAFVLIGALGVVVHFAVLTLSFKAMGLPFAASQAGATGTAMVFNFSVNNLLTYAGRSLRGLAWFKGLASFALVCGLGAFANVGVAAYLFGRHAPWPLAALAGIALSAVWNYAVSARYTWKATG
jgi:dolichol-phosphate mannosyltransferase